MMYLSQYNGKFVLPSGEELLLGDIGDADPDNLGIQMAIADGWLVEVIEDDAHADPEPSIEPVPPPVAAKGKKE